MIVFNDKGSSVVDTCWQIVAFPQKLADSSPGLKNCLAFRLVGHNDSIINENIRGSFNFETMEKTIFGGKATHSKFPSRSINISSKLNNCVRYYPNRNLIIRVNVNLISIRRPIENNRLQQSMVNKKVDLDSDNRDLNNQDMNVEI